MEILVFVPLAIGITIAFTQLVKAAGLPGRIAPLIEFALGVLLVVAGVGSGAVTLPMADLPVNAAWFWSALYGAIVGLSAGGFYTDRRTAGQAVSAATSP